AVQLERGEVLVELCRREVTRRWAAGICHQDVDPAEGIAGAFDERDRAFGRRDVGNQRYGALTDAIRRYCDRVLVAATDRDVNPLGGEGGGGGVAESTAGGCDRGAATGDPEVHALPPDQFSRGWGRRCRAASPSRGRCAGR